MTNNEKLARWQGARDCRGSKNNKSKWKWPTSYDPNLFYYKALPDYLNDDAAAMSLLDTLVKKGRYPDLSYCEVGMNTDRFLWHVRLFDGEPWTVGNTRREAVVAACLELIEKENINDPTR